MGLKNFLQQQGFIAADAQTKQAAKTADKPSAVPPVTPVYFPVNAATATATSERADPSFVTPLQKPAAVAERPDASFIKFFEDELLKANLPGPDYFEFRQQLVKTQQKMAAKGVVAQDLVLAAVMTSFEAQEVSSAKLAEAAAHYKAVLKQKTDDFLKGAASEKNNQLQQRQQVLKAHEDSIRQLQQQLQQLELQRVQLEETIAKEKMQLEADKTLGQEGISKIERAEQQIAIAHAFMQTAIEADIKRLQSM
jgi:hypothetical protein